MGYIDEQIRELREIAEMYEGMDGGDILRESADTIESLYKKLKEKNNGGWIPCSDRLPTKEESIKNDNRFILDDGNRRYRGLFDYEKQCFVQFDFWKGLVEDKCAIAWQPLPEAYHGQMD